VMASRAFLSPAANSSAVISPRLRALPLGCFRLHCGFLLRRKGRVAFAGDEDRVALALLVPEGRTGGFAALSVVRPVLEDVEVGSLFRLGRLVFGSGCHVRISSCLHYPFGRCLR